MAAVSEPEGRAGPEQEGEEGAAGASVLASQLVSFHALPSHPLPVSLTR